ncbi:hypothetical protein Taro_046200 [Colocasia esculenta]|uniref:F-box domain-containing protein n=1 Tax=Colocasia esculenta TaxID=4460 RepID=A0A843X5A9_COLES|nr:hypothetical protein [Colocasia esculenta]
MPLQDIFSSIRGADPDLISKLPDECTTHIFSYLTSPRDRCSCAAVSRKWLLLQALMGPCDFRCPSPTPSLCSFPEGLNGCNGEQADETKTSRFLAFGSANDARLAAMAVGACALERAVTHLTIRTHFIDPPPGSSLLEVTDRGLKIVSRAFPELRYVTLLGCDAVSNEGLAAVATCCPMLEGLHLFNACQVSEDGLIAVALNCLKLSSLTLHMCHHVGDGALKAFAQWSSNLEFLSLDDCPLMGHDGLAAVLSSAPRLAKVAIAFMEVRDVALEAVAGRGGESSVLSLSMEEVSGFTHLGFRQLVQAAKLHGLSVRRCAGMDVASFSNVVGSGNRGLSGATAAVGLRRVAVRNCEGFTDGGLIVLSESARQIAYLRLEKCHKVTTRGIVNAISNCSGTLKLLSLVMCNGIGASQQQQEEGVVEHGAMIPSRCPHLQTLVIKNCRQVGDEFLSLVGRAVGKATRIEVVGMRNITDRGFVSLLMYMKRCSSMREVDLSGYKRITDWSVVALVGASGETLNRITLRGCLKLTDRSLRVIGQLCPLLDELDLTGCRGIGDSGVAGLLARGAGGGAALEVLQAARDGTAPRKSLLDTLSLEGCEGVTDGCLRILADMAVHGSLVWVNLKGTGVSQGGIEALRKAFPWCHFLQH